MPMRVLVHRDRLLHRYITQIHMYILTFSGSTFVVMLYFGALSLY